MAGTFALTKYGMVSLQMNPRLSQNLEAVDAATRKALDQFLYELILEVRWRVAMRTPVLTGRLRGNWRVGINQPDTYSDVDFFDPTGEQGQAEAKEIARNAKAGDTIYISNALPYAGPIERGHSKKAPQGMLHVTAAEMPFIVEQLARGLAGRLHGAGDAGPTLGVPPGGNG